jgi:tetratricopeptide (TPR) repeat protein
MKKFGLIILMQASLGVLSGLILSFAVQAAEPTTAVLFSTKQFPPWAETGWSEYRTQRASGQIKEAAETLSQIRKQAAAQGIRGFDLLAAVMIKDGEEALSKGNINEAVELGETARKWSPDDPNSAFFLARALFNQHPFSPFAAVRNYIRGLSAAAHDFWSSFYFIGRLVLVLFVGLLGSFIVFFAFLLIRYLPLLVHGLGEWVGTFLNRPAVWVLVLTLLFTPVLIGTGPGFLFLVGLCLVWRFMTTSERLISATLGIALGLSVYWLPSTFSWLTADQSPELLLLSQVIRGDAAATGSAARIEERGGYEKNWPVLFSLALQKKREGNYAEALERYQEVQKLEPDRSIILNNMGNVYFLMQRHEEAVASYKLSIGMNPQDAASHYNLGLVYRELLRFNDAEQENEAAQRINPSLIQSYTGLGPMDELFPRIILWKIAFSNSPSKGTGSQRLFEEILWPLSIGKSPYFLLFFASGVIAAHLALSRKYTAAPCTLCGRPVCYHCQRRILDLKTCATCWRNFKNVKRKSDLRQIKTRRRWIFRTARWISILFPGAGHFYFGQEIKGFVFLTVFFGTLFAFFFRNGFPQAPMEHGEILGFVSLSLILTALVILYALVLHDISKLSYDNA